MQTVGLRELKNRLSQYIRRVRDGQLVIVTDRGQVVAELRPPGQTPAGTKIDPAVARLVNRGLLVPGARNDARSYPRQSRSMRSGTITTLLDAERGNR